MYPVDCHYVQVTDPSSSGPRNGCPAYFRPQKKKNMFYVNQASRA